MKPQKPKQHDHEDLFRSRLDQILDRRHLPGKSLLAIFLGIRVLHSSPSPGSEFPDPLEKAHWTKGNGTVPQRDPGDHQAGNLTERHMERINVDTTVQKKAIAYPTDARLNHKARVLLVRAAKKTWYIALRQSYLRLGKQVLIMSSRYAHTWQMRRARREQKNLKNYLGRIYRNILRNSPEPDAELTELLHLAKRLLTQQRHDKKKLYSLHAPDSAIEPVIGHMKEDNRMARTYLKKTDGDKMNAILAACGFNLRKLLRAFFWLLFKELERLKLPLIRFKFISGPQKQEIGSLG